MVSAIFGSRSMIEKGECDFGRNEITSVAAFSVESSIGHGLWKTKEKFDVQPSFFPPVAECYDFTGTLDDPKRLPMNTT
jgi:hypothetical protein